MRYVLHPGFVISQSDGDEHFISADALRRLYRVPPDARIEVIREGDPSHWFRPQPGDVHLHPRYDGNYTIASKSDARDT